jgi:high-affinity iron transporter
MGFEQYFSFQVFFLILRETLETAIIVSVLLAFLKQGFKGRDETSLQMYRKLVIQVWVGAGLGLLICCAVGALFILIFYTVGTNLWSFTEKIWEATFSIMSSVIITFMGLALLRINKMKEKWRLKLARVIIERHHHHHGHGNAHEHKRGVGHYLKHLSRKYAMALLPMVTTLREGLEAVVFLGGIGITQPMSSFPLAAVSGIALGSAVGMAMYRFGDHVSMKYFMVGATCFLYLVAAGLFSRGVWFIDLQRFVNRVGQDVSESGSGPGSYNINWSVWHVNCCNPQTDGPWMLFNALMGWQNSPTVNSVISYNLYWLFIMVVIFSLKFKEKRGYVPWLPRKWQRRKGYRSLAGANAEDLVRTASLLYGSEVSSNPAPEQQVSGRQPSRPSHDSLNSNTPLVG